MKLKSAIFLVLCCCLPLFWLIWPLIADQPRQPDGTVAMTVKAYHLGYARPGCRVDLVAWFGCTNGSVFRDIPVLAVNYKAKALTVAVTPKEAEVLALTEGRTLSVGGKDCFEAPLIYRLLSWWRTFWE